MSVLTVESVEVRNFKSIAHSGKVDITDFNVLVGKNDAGKSSLLQALEIFLNAGKPSHNQFHKYRDEDIEIEVSFSEVPDELGEVLSEEYYDGSEFVVTREFYKRSSTTPGATTYVNGEELSSGAVNTGDEDLSKAKSRDYIWEYMPSPILIEAERDVSEETKLKGGTLLNQLLVPVLEQGGIGESETIRETKESLEATLAETSNEIGEQLTESIQTHLPDVEEINIQHGGVSLQKAISPTVELKDEYLPDSVDISERGSGVGSLFILSLMQAYVDMQVGEGYFVLFEEPGNWLHPSAERKMLDALRGISEEGGQIMLTTHSEVFIDRTEKGRLYIVKRENGESQFEQVEEDAFRAVDEIGAKNSDLLQSDFVLYVEGPSDARIIEEVCRNAFESWDSRNVIIQHLGGTGNLEYCDPGDLKKINRDCAFLLDSDRESADDEPNSVARDIQIEAEEEGIPCMILDRTAIENYFSAQGVNEVFGLSVDPGFVPEYGDPVEEIERQIEIEHLPEGHSAEDSYSKVKHGREVVRAMYDQGERIEEIEVFVDSCLPSQED
ncbi:ATP-dependent nuclease [Haloplanus halobius]|uniref:ATP-dependent nuclease n=1 Tax=Haloplanus halobius TaxID=2934938 RepID=UPI00200D1243|nr:AAA family ATPase [Haloplanus sp. XH21]